MSKNDTHGADNMNDMDKLTLDKDLAVDWIGFKVYDPAGHQIEELAPLWFKASRLGQLWNIASKLHDAGATMILTK